MSEEQEEYARNYFPRQEVDPAGLRYRLEGDDVVNEVVAKLRGGIIKAPDGTISYNEEYRLMNEEGVARVEFFLRGAVNKINHLTKYKNEERIMRQMRSMCRGFVIELVLNLKRWAPNSYTVKVEREVLLSDGSTRKALVVDIVNPHIEKVTNKHLILHVVENGIFQSMQRGQDGFEAELTGKSWMVSETVGQKQEQERVGGLRGLFSRRNDYG